MPGGPGWVGALLGSPWNQENPAGVGPSWCPCSTWDIPEVFAQLWEHSGLLEVGVAQGWHRGGRDRVPSTPQTPSTPSQGTGTPKAPPQQLCPLQGRCWWQCWDWCPQAGGSGGVNSPVSRWESLLGVSAGNHWESLGITGNSCWEPLQAGRAEVLGRRRRVHRSGDRGCGEKEK